MYGPEKLRLTETGWASQGGYNFAANEASESNMQQYLNDYVVWIKLNGVMGYWFLAFDSEDAPVNAGYESYFGLFHYRGEPKMIIPPL
ncbi:hypothetical protein DD237_008490 [Peronospora effusa]|uniref:glucan endo-1,3-beta-D-glucosidase n=1 Tax=Peronospora effusa TaxID=542832 RepID=A0A3R7XQE1_9STRA|nr:hypothetical protein DD237_008490 [Peronospora effusa]